MSDLRKSINSILHERLTSPLYGTFIVSWLVWNWKIIYLTIVVSESKLKTDKITYIKEHFYDLCNLLWYPLLSTILLLTIVPFISNGAFWLSTKFNRWKQEQKNLIERKQLLTLEQSIDLREEIARQEERFEKMLADKNLRIKQLEQILSDADSGKELEYDSLDYQMDEELIQLAEKIRGDASLERHYKGVVSMIQAGWRADLSITPADFLALLESYDVIKKNTNSTYEWGSEGKAFHKLISR